MRVCRKVRAPQGRVPENVRSAGDDRHMESATEKKTPTADGFSPLARKS
jgi:hypothetical protein